MNQVRNPLRLLILFTALVVFGVQPAVARTPNPPPLYQVLLVRGNQGGDVSTLTATTTLAWPNPRVAGLVGVYIAVQEVPGLNITWSTPGANMIQALDWNPNPKERIVRAAFQYSTRGTYLATCNLSYDDGLGGTATVPVNFTVTVN